MGTEPKPAGMDGHHWLIPQNGWGKAVPDVIKNQPINIKVLTRADHARIHNAYKGARRFDPARQVWYGTPDWFKGLATSTTGRLVPKDNGRQK